MRVLVACEFSGIVRDAFIAAGHDAVSCDLIPSERPGPHFQGDVRELIPTYPLGWWDLMIAHPPCTHLAVSGARWFKDKEKEQESALEFVAWLLSAPVPRIALENPVSVISSRIRKPDQIIQPWWFGHGEVKATCLWLKNLPLLTPTNIVEGRTPRVHHASPGPLEGTLPHPPGHRGCDGGAVGFAVDREGDRGGMTTRSYVLNLRDLPRRNPKSARSYILPAGAVVIDRRTRWGNPYRIGMVSDDPDSATPYNREEVLFLYRHYLRRRLADDPTFLEPLRGRVLGCWCKPEACHGDVIAEYFDAA